MELLRKLIRKLHLWLEQNPPEVVSENPKPSVEEKKDSVPEVEGVLPPVSLTVLTEFVRENDVLVCQFVLRRLKHAIESELSSVELFRVGEDKRTAVLLQKDYQRTLELMMSAFVKKEEYELAHECQSLMIQNSINDVIGIP